MNTTLSTVMFFLYADWPGLIPDDGLLTANQVLCGDCGACTRTSCHPHFSNVIVVSVQPERNIQLFPTSGKPVASCCCMKITITFLELLPFRVGPLIFSTNDIMIVKA